MKTIQNDFYGDSFRWFIGVVVSNNDPLKLGRVKVRIRGIHSKSEEDIPTADLPWAQVIVPSTEGGISGIGKMPQLQNGAQVAGFFADGAASQIPIVMGSLHHIEKKSDNDSPARTESNINRGETGVPESSDNGGSGPAGGPLRSNLNPNSSGFSKEPDAYRLTGGSNGEKVYNYLTGQGLTPEQAAGVVGNLAAESNLDPAAYNPNDVGQPAGGIAQWRGTRLDELKAYSATNSLDWRTLDAQLPFLMYELETKSYLGYGSLTNSNSVEEATRVFEEKFERPAPGTFNRRYGYARDAYDRYANA
jgi:hypothetical protein